MHYYTNTIFTLPEHKHLFDKVVQDPLTRSGKSIECFGSKVTLMIGVAIALISES